MKLSKRTEYGVRAVVQLARLAPGQFIQSRDLAKREKLPNKFLEAILLALRRGGFLESKVGSGGGYRLTRVPSEIFIGELVRRLEGRQLIVPAPPGNEQTGGEFAMRLIRERLAQATADALDELSVEQIVEQINKAAGASAEMYYI